MDKFEYRKERILCDEEVAKLNKLGQEGWELCSGQYVAGMYGRQEVDWYVCVLKRKIVE